MADIGIAELFAAIEEGNVAKVKELIDRGISPNSFKDENRITPLHYCVQFGDVHMFTLLLENKASLRKRDRWMDSVVHYACRYGNTRILQLILNENSRQQNKLQLKQHALIMKFGTPLEKKLKRQKVKPNLLNLKGRECKVPIFEAIINGYISAVVMLFQAGAAIGIQDQHGKAPINLLFDLPSDLQKDMFDKLMHLEEKMEERNFVVEICKYGDLYHNEKIQKKTKEILENFRQVDKEKWLELFLQNDCVAGVKQLLEEPNYYTWNVLQSVLKKAVECDHEEIVRLVLNEQTGITADEDCIKLSIENQNDEILRYLLKFSAQMQLLKTYNIRQIIFMALETGNVDVVTVLFDQFNNPLDYVKVNVQLWVKLIENKYKELIKYLLNAGVKLDDGEGIYHHIKTPLTAAITSKDAIILKLIIAAGAKPSDPQYCLQEAIVTQDIEIVKLALTLPGSNLNDQEITRAAIQTKNSHFLELLIGLGLGLNIPDFTGWTALTLAVETKELNIVRLVYNSGGRFSNSKEELWKAVEHGSKEILDFLIQRCSIFKLRKNSTWTLLHEAVVQDDLEIVKLLVKNMTQINISGKKMGLAGNHETPVALAVLRKNAGITNLLISAGGDINKGGRNLYNAVVSGSEEIVGILLKARISTYLDTQFGLTILHVAVIRNNVNIVRQLLQLQYININAKVYLAHTMENKFKQKFGYLYSRDISYVNMQNEITAIQLAVRQNSEDISRELLNHNADITIANKMGRLPWVEALFNCNHILMNILLQKYQPRDVQMDINALCEIDYKTRNWKEGGNHKNIGHVKNGTLLYFALSLGNLKVVEILLKHGASVSRVNSNGETAIFGLTLLITDREKVYQGVKIIIENGANINHVNDNGSTVLNTAVKEGNHELVNVLILEGADIQSVKDETVEIMLQSKSYSGDKYFCHMKIIHCLLQHGYHFQHLSKLCNWLLSVTYDRHLHCNFENKISSEQHTICEILDHMKSLGFNIKNKVSELLFTCVKYDLQILGKFLLSEDCGDNLSYKRFERNAFDIALENCNFPFVKMILDECPKCIDSGVLKTVLEKAVDCDSSSQISIYSAGLFNIDDLFICKEKKEARIASVINIYDTILNLDIDFEKVFTLDHLQDSAIAYSIKKNIPWALEYFLKNDILKPRLHSEHICKLFDLLLGNFQIDTAKILIDACGTRLLQANPTLLQKLYMNRHVTDKEKINVTQWLMDKGLNKNCEDDDGTILLSMCNNSKALGLLIDKGYFKIVNLLMPYAYPNGVKQSKAESLILDVIKCADRNNCDNSRRTCLKELVKGITSASSYRNLLESAVSKNDFMMVKILLEDRYKIYGENEKQMMSFLSKNIIHASQYHFVEIMEEFINAGVEFELEKGANALHLLCALPQNHVCNEKCFKMLKTLIKEGNMTHMEDENGKLPLHHAITHLNYDASKLLIEAGSFIASYGPESASPLGLYCSEMYDAAQNERIVLITRLLLHTGKALAVNKVPPEVIYDVIVHEREEVLFLLSKYTTHLGYRDSDGNTALHIACKRGNCKLLTMLLDLECEVNAQNNDGKTPLLLACEQGKYDFIKILVQHGARPDVPDNNGITPIHMGIIIGLYEAVLLFLIKPCNVNKKTTHAYKMAYEPALKAGSTPLTTVLVVNSYKLREIAEKLIDAGADVDICNEDGDTPLHIAIRNMFTEALLQKLLSRSVDIGIQNSKGWSVLHLAVKYQKQNIVQIMLKEKYDVNARIYDHSEEFPGYTALHIAVDKTNVSLVDMLLKAGGSMSKKDATGKTAMDLCGINVCMTEKLSLWSVLLKAGGSVRRLIVHRDFLKILQESNLLDLLIESGCVLQFEGQNMLEPGCSLLEYLTNQQQQPQSLMRLAANTVRTNIHPNALYGSSKLPLPESVQQYICFNDGKHDVNEEYIQLFAQHNNEQSNVLNQRDFGALQYYDVSDYDVDDYYDDYYDNNPNYDSDDIYYDSDW